MPFVSRPRHLPCILFLYQYVILSRADWTSAQYITRSFARLHTSSYSTFLLQLKFSYRIISYIYIYIYHFNFYFMIFHVSVESFKDLMDFKYSIFLPYITPSKAFHYKGILLASTWPHRSKHHSGVMRKKKKITQTTVKNHHASAWITWNTVLSNTNII